MILVTGGLASGKRTYAAKLAQTMGCPADEVVIDAHELVGTRPRGELVKDLSGRAIVTVCEVGSGIVPLDPAQRAWREEVGRMGCELAAKAETVVRMVCGIPVALKGGLPEVLSDERG